MMTIRLCRTAALLSFFTVVAGGCWPSCTATAASAQPLASTVEPNDNTRRAGSLDRGTLTLALRAGAGHWKPEGPSGPALHVEAFGEIGSPLTVPAPLVRVAEGTQIEASIRNDLGSMLTVHGLCARDGAACAALEIPPRQTRSVRFSSGRAGTYHYWASSMGAPIPFRELAGAFVVDPSTGPVEPDRVMVITEWTNLTREQLGEIIAADDASEVFVRMHPRFTFTINGLSWPATERLTYRLGERVRWRVINLSSQTHPMHLHGFYFDVDSLGNGLRDVAQDDSHRRRVVTQLLPSGGTMSMTWTPEREGNWLFHCHIMSHVSPERRLPGGADGEAQAAHHAAHHAAAGAPADHDPSRGMAGMVVGVTVLRPETSEHSDNEDKVAPTTPKRSSHLAPRTSHIDPRSSSQPRKLTLLMERGPERDGRPTAGFVLCEGDVTSTSERPVAPGPPLVLRRDEPVEITVVNNLGEPTAMHWHGIELESYYDGVHGWSGAGRRLAPMIDPGGSFVVRFTPPRAGTFIYHTHLHDFRQLSSGLYGPIVVTDPGETFDPVTDHVIVLGRSGVDSMDPSVLSDPASVVMNGERAPRLVWKAGTRHHLRVINITTDDIFVVGLQGSDGPVMWKAVKKDGALLPDAESMLVPARQTIAVGETYEFDYEAPPGRSRAWLDVRTTSGKWQAQGEVIVR